MFSKKPKTFMDYEPGKLPSNKDWDTQTKSETKNYAPFASNVKKVGDNVTKKDYDDFFEGFNDPYGEKREQERQQKEQERKERFAKIRANADNRTWSSQSASTSQTDAFVKGFNKEKTTGILNPHLPYDTDRAFGLLGTEESELKPTVQRLNASPAITNAINRNLNAKNEYTPIGTYDPNKKYSATLYSTNSKESFIDKVFSKEVNNNIYTSKGNSYTEKSKGTIGISKSDYYYAEKDGKRYPANSLETVNYYDWNSIDENFLNGKFESLIAEANKNDTDIARILTESIGGDLDFKQQLDEKTLYLINGVLYNKNEAGNFVWAYFLESHKYSGLFSGALAQAGTLLPSFANMNGSTRLDEEWDRRARWAGVRYYYEKNNKLPLYYYLYGNKIKY
ncbi:MAG: hypothetical protein UHD64_02285 [Bacteroidales bacterium]|nr:hypothetical protein [Bacteroidales bacterium]